MILQCNLLHKNGVTLPAQCYLLVCIFGLFWVSVYNNECLLQMGIYVQRVLRLSIKVS